MGKITIKQIAEELNVSRNTISKVMHNKGGVSEETRNFILQKASKMGYKQAKFMLAEETKKEEPQAKQFLPKGSFLLVTERIPTNRHFGVRALETLRKEIDAKGFALEFCIVTPEEMNNRIMPRGMDVEKVKGIVCIEMFNKDYSAFLCEYGKPILFIDTAVGFNENYPNMDLVLMENQNSVEKLIDKMLSMGCQKFGFIGDKNHCRSFYERWAVCDKILRQVGISDFDKSSIIDADQVGYQDFCWLRGKLDMLEEFPEVFFCANDQIAITLLHALKEMGHNVPEEIKVIGFDDMPEAAVSNPTLTTVHINSDGIGKIAANLLISRVDDETLPPRYTYVQTIPIYRKST